MMYYILVQLELALVDLSPLGGKWLQDTIDQKIIWFQPLLITESIVKAHIFHRKVHVQYITFHKLAGLGKTGILIWTGQLFMKLRKSKCCIFLFVSLSIFPPEIKLQQKFLNDYDNELQSVIEKYITMDIPKYHRSIIAQYRCGVIPIRIETGWFRGIDYVFYVL